MSVELNEDSSHKIWWFFKCQLGYVKFKEAKNMWHGFSWKLFLQNDKGETHVAAATHKN